MNKPHLWIIISLVLLCKAAHGQNYAAQWTASPSEKYGIVTTYSVWWQYTNAPSGSSPTYLLGVNVSTNTGIGGIYTCSLPIGTPNDVYLFVSADQGNSSAYSQAYYFDTNSLNKTAPLMPPTAFSVKLKP